MLLKELIDKLDLLKKVASRTEKYEVLKDLFTSPEGERIACILKYTYNKELTYGIKNIREISYKEPGEGLTVPQLVYLLSTLSLHSTGNLGSRNRVIKHLTSVTSVEEHDFVCNIFERNLRLGIGVSLINKAYKAVFSKELIYKFSIMAAYPYKEKNIVYPCQVETKLDGIRAFIVCNSLDDVTIYSRSGKVLNKKFPEIVAQIHGFSNDESTPFSYYGNVLDCEIVAQTFQAVKTRLTKSVKPNATPVHLVIFDTFSVEEWNNLEVKKVLKDRWKSPILTISFVEQSNIFQIPKLHVVTRSIAYDLEDVQKFYKWSIQNGYEGIVIKNLDGKYLFNCSYNWIKLKPTLDIDLKVVAIKEGEGKNIGKVGALVVRYKGTFVNIGTGLNDEERKMWFKNPSLIIGKTIEVHYQSVTKDNSLFFNSFHRIKERI